MIVTLELFLGVLGWVIAAIEFGIILFLKLTFNKRIQRMEHVFVSYLEVIDKKAAREFRKKLSAL